MLKYCCLSLLALGLALAVLAPPTSQAHWSGSLYFKPENYKQKLSEYEFFEGPAQDLKPAKGVRPYFLNTPLFSDHAHKARFMVLPQGQSIKLKDNGLPDFPIGTVLIKHFYYPEDFKQPTQALRFMETRLLIHEASGWVPLCYVWDKDQKDASLDIAGESIPVSWKDEQGKAHKIDYQVPSLLQCRYCHTIGNEIRPIGPTARQLKTICREPWASAELQGKDQLELWQSQGLLSGTSHEKIEPMAVWNRPETGSLTQRARAWLDVNCAHCHSAEASAGITGLYLNYEEQDPLRLGINKKPITGLMATDNRPFDIVAGQPEQSILVYRIESTDHRVRMPKISCQVPDLEGIDLIKAWIRAMPK